MSEDEEDVDVQALLDSINANFEPSNSPENQISQGQSQEQKDTTDTNSNEQIIIVRQNAEKTTKEYDPIQEILDQIEDQNSLMTDKTIQEHQLDTSSLQVIVAKIKQNFDFRQDIITQNQRYIINKIGDIKNSTNRILAIQQAKEYTISKVKPSEMIQKIKELNNLDLQVFKTKGYVLTMLERLEIIESNMDRIIDYHVKQKMDHMEQIASKLNQQQK